MARCADDVVVFGRVGYKCDGGLVKVQGGGGGRWERERRRIKIIY